MIFGLQIGLLVAGIIALVTGKMKVGRDRVIEDPSARLLGLLAILPLPLSFGIGFVIGYNRARRGLSLTDPSFQWTMIVMEAAVTLVISVVVFGGGFLVSSPTQRRKQAPIDEDDYFRRCYPERFGGTSPSPAAVQGSVPLQTVALGNPGPPGLLMDIAREPEKKGQALFPTWVTFLLVACLSGVLWFVLRLGGNSTPAVEPRPQGDHDNRWQAYEVADMPPQIPGQVEDALLKPGARVYLSDLQEFAWKPGAPGWVFGKAGNLGSLDKPKVLITIGKRRSAKGLSMHPPDTGYTRVCYYLGRRADTFQAGAGLANFDPSTKANPTRLVVLGDGKLLYRSASHRNSAASSIIALDVSEVNVLELRTYVETGNSTGSHAIWLDPFVVVKK